MESQYHLFQVASLSCQDQVSSLEIVLGPALLQSANIHQLHSLLEGGDQATAIHDLVTSRLVYCNAVYMGLPFKVQKL